MDPHLARKQQINKHEHLRVVENNDLKRKEKAQNIREHFKVKNLKFACRGDFSVYF